MILRRVGRKVITVEAPVSGHPGGGGGGGAEIVSVTGAGRLLERVNTNIVWEPGKKRFCQGGRK